MPKVYIPNKSFHDFSGARRYGKLVYLTEGQVDRRNVNQLYRVCSEGMADANADDYIVISSLGILNAVVCSIMAYRFGRLNILLWWDGDYVVRTIALSEVLTQESGPIGQ